MITPANQQAAIAQNRFGLGVRPDEPAITNPKAWLLSQMERYHFLTKSVRDSLAATPVVLHLRQASSADGPAPWYRTAVAAWLRDWSSPRRSFFTFSGSCADSASRRWI